MIMFRSGGKRHVWQSSSRFLRGSPQRERRECGACTLGTRGDPIQVGGRACTRRSCISVRVLPGHIVGT
eukprot:4857353-Pleurochrysis_carterae.AAC.1